MDKAIVLGGYEFLSFYLCTAFLEKGNTVYCVHTGNINDAFLEEKRFSVGRNANFFEHTLSDWSAVDVDSADAAIVILSLYDLFFKKEADQLMTEMVDAFGQALKQGRLDNSHIILILPMQFLDLNQHPFSEIIKEMSKSKLNVKCIYSPTLYGPWQPLEYAFQQAFLHEVDNKQGSFQLSEKEWVYDTIYVSSAVEGIMKVIEDDSIQTCILKSSVPEHWKKCADYLSISPEIFKEDCKVMNLNFDIPNVEIQQSVSLEEGLNIQKQHLVRILSEV